MLVQLLCVAGIDTLTVLATLSARQLRIVRAWMTPLEVMVRKLLLIEAASLEPTPQRLSKPKHADTRSVRQRTRAFTVIPAGARPSKAPQRIRSLGPPLLVRDAWREAQRTALIARLRASPRPAPTARLANRIRALASVIHNPAPHARRLARLLSRSTRATEAMDCIAYTRLRSAPREFCHPDFDRACTGAHNIDRTPLLPKRR